MRDHCYAAILTPTTAFTQATDYYPFGMAYTLEASATKRTQTPEAIRFDPRETDESTTFTRNNAYLYNGKEEQPMPGKWLDYVNFGGKVMYKLTAKIMNQMSKRGWTKKLISKTLESKITREATNKATGNKATAFFAKDGSYVVKDDVTNENIQVSDRLRSWTPDQTIVNPYIPK